MQTEASLNWAGDLISLAQPIGFGMGRGTQNSFGTWGRGEKEERDACGLNLRLVDLKRKLVDDEDDTKSMFPFVATIVL